MSFEKKEKSSIGGVWFATERGNDLPSEKLDKITAFLKDNNIYLSIKVKDERYVGFVNGFRKKESQPNFYIPVPKQQGSSKSAVKKDNSFPF